MSYVPESPKPSHERALLMEFARFILANHKEDFFNLSYQLLRNYDVPLLRPLSEQDGRALADVSNGELLDALANNNPQDHIQKAIGRWQENQFPRVQQNMGSH